jgi:ribosomal-protein-alanine N-acetyltransferase
MLNLHFIPFPALETERLSLREVKPSDVAEIFTLRSELRIMTYLDRSPAKSEEEAMQFIELNDTALKAGNGICWGMCQKGSDKLIGTVAIWRIIKEHHRGEVGYTLHPDHQGKGLMDEAFKAVIKYGFEKIRLHSLEANVNPENKASIRLLQKNGFVKEAHFRENYYYDGKYLDSAIYSLISSI